MNQSQIDTKSGWLFRGVVFIWGLFPKMYPFGEVKKIFNYINEAF